MNYARIRRYTYRVAYAAAPLLVTYGLLDSNQVVLWLSVAGAVLGVGADAAEYRVERKAARDAD